MICTLKTLNFMSYFQKLAQCWSLLFRQYNFSFIGKIVFEISPGQMTFYAQVLKHERLAQYCIRVKREALKLLISSLLLHQMC